MNGPQAPEKGRGSIRNIVSKYEQQQVAAKVDEKARGQPKERTPQEVLFHFLNQRGIEVINRNGNY
jgi:hypothetical protein